MTSKPGFQFDAVKVREALRKVLTSANCPISGDRDWIIAPGYVEIRAVSTFPTVSFPVTSGRVEVSGGSFMGMPGILKNVPPGGAVVMAGLPPIEEAAYPIVMATCKQCGYVALFNAVALGLVSSEVPDEKNEQIGPGGR